MKNLVLVSGVFTSKAAPNHYLVQFSHSNARIGCQPNCPFNSGRSLTNQTQSEIYVSEVLSVGGS